MTTTPADDTVLAPLSSTFFRFPRPLDIGPVRIIGTQAHAGTPHTSTGGLPWNDAEILAAGGRPLGALVASPMLGIRDRVGDPTALPFVADRESRAEASDIWLATPDALEVVERPGAADTELTDALGADKVIGTTSRPVGVAYIPRDRLPTELKTKLPPCTGSFLFVPGELGQFQTVSFIRLSSIRVGSGTVDGQTGPTVLSQQGKLLIAPASGRHRSKPGPGPVSARIRRPASPALLGAWLASALAALLTLVPLFVLWSAGATIAVIVIVLFLGLFYDQAHNHFRGWRQRYKLRRFIAAWCVAAGAGIIITLLGEGHVLPTPVMAVAAIVLLGIFFRIFVAGYAAIAGLTILGMLILITGAARKLSTAWYVVITTLARWSLHGLAAAPLGHRVRSTVQASADALPFVTRGLVLIRTRLMRSSRRPMIRIRQAPGAAQLANAEHHHHHHQ